MAIKRKREALVHQHLEQVSRSLLEKHQDVVKREIGRNAGIYALYKKGKLYYVGLASTLAGRLKQHLHDSHGEKWDQFSIYFTIRDQHIKEIESLLLQIARPKGNKQIPKAKASTNMKPSIQRAIRKKQKNELSDLIGKEMRPTVKRLKGGSVEAGALSRLFPLGVRLRGTNKGRNYTARVRRDGKIRFNGEVFKSLNLAGKKALGRSTNGWWFWMAERGKGHWVRLLDIRKAGTPVLPK